MHVYLITLAVAAVVTILVLALVTRFIESNEALEEPVPSQDQLSYKEVTEVTEVEMRFHLELANISTLDEEKKEHKAHATGVFFGWVASTAPHRKESDLDRLESLVSTIITVTVPS
jgi:hypothetical protein